MHCCHTVPVTDEQKVAVWGENLLPPLTEVVEQAVRHIVWVVDIPGCGPEGLADKSAGSRILPGRAGNVQT